jgi:DNA repair exonuclease SbcCD ATPase subunit
MDSYINSNKRRGRRAVGAVAPATSILLILSLQGVLAAQPAPSREPMDVSGPPQGSAIEPGASIDNRLSALSRSRGELIEKARKDQEQLADLTARRGRLAAEMQSLYEQMRGIETDLGRLDERRRRGMEDEIAREQERARNLIEQTERLRRETGEVQRRIEDLDRQGRRQATEIDAALKQTQRDLREMDQWLNRYGISYAPRTEPPAPKPKVEQPVPQVAPGAGKAAVESNESLRIMQEQNRRLQAESEAALQRELPLESPTPPDSGSPPRSEERHDQQRQRSGGAQAPPGYRDNPYSVGSADHGWIPNTYW